MDNAFICIAWLPMQRPGTARVAFASQLTGDFYADMNNRGNRPAYDSDESPTLETFKSWAADDHQWGNAEVIPLDKPQTVEEFRELVDRIAAGCPRMQDAIEAQLVKTWRGNDEAGIELAEQLYAEGK